MFPLWWIWQTPEASRASLFLYFLRGKSELGSAVGEPSSAFLLVLFQAPHGSLSLSFSLALSTVMALSSFEHWTDWTLNHGSLGLQTLKTTRLLDRDQKDLNSQKQHLFWIIFKWLVSRERGMAGPPSQRQHRPEGWQEAPRGPVHGPGHTIRA